MNRRTFLGATAATVLATRWRLGTAPSLGLELWAYDDRTLSAVAAIGYRDMAVNDVYAPALRAALARAGLAASAVHVTTPLLYRGLDRHLAAAADLGIRYFVVGRLDPEERRTPQDWHELAALFNRAGETTKKAGLKFGYRVLGAEIEIMNSETDPALVWFEGKVPRNRFFAVDVTDANDLRGTAGVEHIYVQASSVDAARAAYLSLSRLRS